MSDSARARLSIRPAMPADLAGLHGIAEHAVWGLLATHHYTARQLEAVRAVQGYSVEPELIEDGTYYVLEVDGALVGGCGWSDRSSFHPPLSRAGAAVPRLDPRTDAAVMRAAYLDPAWGRRGLATLLANVAETAAPLPASRASVRGGG